MDAKWVNVGARELVRQPEPWHPRRGRTQALDLLPVRRRRHVVFNAVALVVEVHSARRRAAHAWVDHRQIVMLERRPPRIRLERREAPPHQHVLLQLVPEARPARAHLARFAASARAFPPALQPPQRLPRPRALARRILPE